MARFVAAHIRTLEQLEVLLLVSALPDRDWTADEVYQVVKTNPGLVVQRLEEFASRGLLTAGTSNPRTYRFSPRTEDLGRQVASLSSFYKMARHKIVELIYSPEIDEMRAFSDAFRIKRRE